MFKTMGAGMAGVALLLGGTAAQAADVDRPDYHITYSENAFFDNFSWSDTGFSWRVTEAVSAFSTGTPVNLSFAIPDFSFTTKPGWSFSDLGGFLGNLAFTRLGVGSEISISLTGTITMGSSSGPVGGFLSPTTLQSGANNFAAGYYSAGSATPGGFTSFSFTGGNLNVTVDGSGGLASALSQNQGKLEVSFLAAPVPEPGIWAMLLAGLGLMMGVALRRRSVQT